VAPEHFVDAMFHLRQLTGELSVFAVRSKVDVEALFAASMFLLRGGPFHRVAMAIWSDARQHSLARRGAGGATALHGSSGSRI